MAEYTAKVHVHCWGVCSTRLRVQEMDVVNVGRGDLI